MTNGTNITGCIHLESCENDERVRERRHLGGEVVQERHFEVSQDDFYNGIVLLQKGGAEKALTEKNGVGGVGSLRVC
jgi:hypothetical protein